MMFAVSVEWAENTVIVYKWSPNEKQGQTTRLGHSEVEPFGTRGRFKMDTFTTKAFCATESFHCL